MLCTHINFPTKEKRRSNGKIALYLFSFGWLSGETMRYSILTYEDGTITPIMPFIYDEEITAEGIDEAIKKRRRERYPLPVGYHPLPADADCILLAEYADYDTFERKPIQHVEQMTMGYSGCIAAFKMADRTLTEMRDPTEAEKDACKQVHTFTFVPKLKKYRKKKEENGNEE